MKALLILATTFFLLPVTEPLVAEETQDFLPTVRVQPQYPRKAIVRGLSGCAVVLLDVKEDGSTTNVRVVDSNPKKVFDKAAIKAAKKFKYDTRDGAGNREAVKGVSYMFTWALQGNGPAPTCSAPAQ